MITSLDISVEETIRENSTQFDITAEHGELTALLFPKSTLYDKRTLHILSLDTDRYHRQQGIGKALLRTSLEIAQEREAESVTSLLISRECIEAMRSVFGEDSVYVKKLGTFSHDDQTHYDATAILEFDVPALSV